MGRRVPPEDEFIYPEFREFIIYLASTKTNSRATIAVTTKNLMYVGRVLRAMEVSDITQVTTQQLLDAHLQASKTWGWNQNNTCIIALNGFFKWMLKEKRMHGDFALPSFPRNIKERPKAVPQILMPKDLFRIRMLDRIPLGAAAYIELMISSGMRSSELRCVHASQIRFNEAPVEFSTGKPSRFAGGMIALQADLQPIKREKSRIVFFSKMASHMLHLYMEDMGIKPGSNIPIFPYSTATIHKWLDMIREELPHLKAKPAERHITKPLDVKDMDLDEDSPEFLKKLVQGDVARKNRFHGPVDPRIGRSYNLVTRGIHPHRLRYTFACYQYFRNYYGEIHSMDRLRIMMGHDDIDTTLIYLTQIAAISSMQEWEQIHIGRPMDWSRCKTKKYG